MKYEVFKYTCDFFKTNLYLIMECLTKPEYKVKSYLLILKDHLEKNPDLERLLPHIKQNIGFVFTNEELVDVMDLL